jgi:RNase P subunit RPR2
MQVDGPRFVGAVGCKSSSCHGGAGEKRSQYLTWLEKDFHTRAYAILTTARSERIASAAGISAATKDHGCTSCHMPLQKVQQVRLTKTADPHEGVSCENCHGAAEPWLRGHTRKDWTYGTRVGAGMRDLKNFYVRANTCVACHENIDAKLLAAGHPELIFELDGQSVAQPKHWHDPPESGARAWLVGQAVALRELSWRLTLTGPSDARAVAQWQGLAWLLAEATAADGTLTRIGRPGDESDDAAFRRTQQQADELARQAAQRSLGRQFARGLLRQLASLDGTFAAANESPREIAFSRAQRLILALERLSLAALDQQAGSSVAPEFVALRDELQMPTDFDPARFGQQLERYRLTLSP